VIELLAIFLMLMWVLLLIYASGSEVDLESACKAVNKGVCPKCGGYMTTFCDVYSGTYLSCVLCGFAIKLRSSIP